MKAGTVLWSLSVLFAYALLAGAGTALAAVNRLRLHHLSRSRMAKAAILESLMHPPHRTRDAVCFAAMLLRGVFLVGVMSLASSETFPRKCAWCLGAAILLTGGDSFSSLWFSMRPIDRLSRILPVLRGLERAFGPLIRRTKEHAEPTRGSTEEGPVISRETLDRLLLDGVRIGTISGMEHKMISRVFALQNRPVADIMTPASQMVFVHASTPLRDFYERCRETGLIRMPVLDSGTGRFAGIINVFYVVGQLTDQSRAVGEFMRPPLFVPTTASVAEILPRMRLNRQPMALIHDLDGTVVGLATVDDALEAITGGDERTQSSQSRQT